MDTVTSPHVLSVAEFVSLFQEEKVLYTNLDDLLSSNITSGVRMLSLDGLIVKRVKTKVRPLVCPELE